jgi:hypothetical protein
MGLAQIVGFTFGHLIAFSLAIWCIVEMENQNLTQASLSVKLLVAYDLGLLLSFIGAIAWNVLSARNKQNVILNIDTQSAVSSLDLEDK